METPLCECGCGQRVGLRKGRRPNRFLPHHHPRGQRFWSMQKQQVCECGCGGRASPGKRFVHGHYVRVNNPLKRPELRAKQSARLTGANNPGWKGGGYSMAHQRAAARLGPPPAQCPACGSAEYRMELSYVGSRPERITPTGLPYDPTGRDYIYECARCHRQRHANPAPPKPCRNCARLFKPLRRGLCGACDARRRRREKAATDRDLVRIPIGFR
jgi:hypothetical protein